MATIIKKINLTDEETDILVKAKWLLNEISDQIGEDYIEEYVNSEYITEIADIVLDMV